MLDGLVGDGKLTEVVADHLGLDLDLNEAQAVVDADDTVDHLGDDHDVAHVRLDGGGLLIGTDGLALRSGGKGGRAVGEGWCGMEERAARRQGDQCRQRGG